MLHEIGAADGEDFGVEMLATLHELESRAGIKLSPFEKVLLAEIATVEQVLSIIADSSIRVTLLESGRESEAVTLRRAALQDASGATLLLAETRVYTSRLSEAVRCDLAEGRGGIGTILRRHAVETLRCVDRVGYDSTTRRLYRRYRIIHGGQTWFDIREEFAAGRF